MPKQPRRHFLLHSAAALTLAPALWAGLPASRNRTYQVAVIGSTGRGDYGHGIDTVWAQHPRTRVVAVADDHAKGLVAAGKRLKVDRLFADYRVMLRDIKPDIVAICPRWLDQHHDMFIAAAQAGAHVYIEKPLCQDLAQADAMVAAADKAGVKCAVAHQTRWSPKIPLIRRLIAEGRIGRLLEVRGRGKEDRRGGAEDLWVLGSHVMNMITTFAGVPRSCFATLHQGDQPVAPAHVKPGPEGIGPLAGDRLTAVYQMADGVTAYFNSIKDAGSNPPRFGILLVGSKGLIEMTFGYLPAVKFLPDPAWSPGQTGSKWLNISSAGIDQPEPIKDGSIAAGNLAAASDLLDSIENNRRPLCSIHDAATTIEMIAAVFESHRLAGPVDVPLKSRKNPLKLLADRP